MAWEVGTIRFGRSKGKEIFIKHNISRDNDFSYYKESKLYNLSSHMYILKKTHAVALGPNLDLGEDKVEKKHRHPKQLRLE